MDGILIAECPDSGWMPLFINISGLILEAGGAWMRGGVFPQRRTGPV